MIESTQTGTIRHQLKMVKLTEDVKLERDNFTLELDTGVCDNFISKSTWERLGKPNLEPTTVNYKSASGHLIETIGRCKLTVQIDSQKEVTLPFVISAVQDLNLLGRTAIQQLGISIDDKLQQNLVSTITENQPDGKLQTKCKEMCKEFPEIFKDELECFKNFQLEINFKPSTKPVFCRPRPVPIALTEELNQAYEARIAKGIWEPTQFNQYGTPVVPVRKSTSNKATGNIRVCGDYSKTINNQLKTHRKPIPLPEDLIRKLGGGYCYTTIDLADAYNQILLAPESLRRLALSTHKGVLLQKRLPFGISSAPGYFQKITEQLTQDLPGVAVYLDDILVSGANAESHL